MPKGRRLSMPEVPECREKAEASAVEGRDKEQNGEDNEDIVSEENLDKRNAWYGSLCAVFYMPGIDR